MSLEQLLTTPPSSKEIENKPVSPTLLLGLGGTGNHSPLRLQLPDLRHLFRTSGFW